jgi:hypothetical protein
VRSKILTELLQVRFEYCTFMGSQRSTVYTPRLRLATPEWIKQLIHIFKEGHIYGEPNNHLNSYHLHIRKVQICRLQHEENGIVTLPLSIGEFLKIHWTQEESMAGKSAGVEGLSPSFYIDFLLSGNAVIQEDKSLDMTLKIFNRGYRQSNAHWLRVAKLQRKDEEARRARRKD